MAWRNLKANGRKTITLFLAVLLSSFLIFTIFTVGNSYFKLQKLQNIRMSGADFDAIMYGVTEEQRQICENAPEIILTGTIGICGWVEKTEKDSTPNVGLVWADDGYWTQMMESVREKLEGKYPKAFNEIMVTKEALKECGYEDLTVGDTLTMSYGTYSGTATGSFRISGIWDGYGPKKQFYVSKEFYDQSGWQLSQSASGRYLLIFKQKLMTQKEQKAFIERMNLGKQQSLFFTEDPGTSLQILAGLLGLSAVTCLCAYLLIYNIMYLSVAGKVRYYGLLQTIGMTETQIKRMMKEQMLLLGLAGTGTGCLLGVLVSFFLIPVVIKSLGIKSSYVGSVMICFHPVILIATVLLVGTTIFLAARKPVKMAANISPMEALGYRAAGKGGKAGRKGKIIRRLSWGQFTKDKKRTTVVILSLATSLSVYLCITTMLDSQAGFRTKWLSYHNVERAAGETKWSFGKLLRYSLDGIMGFSTLPLSLSSYGGIFFCGAAFLAILFLVVRYLIWHDPVQGWTTLMCAMLLISGVQLLCVGILGQYLARIYLEVKNRPVYLLKETDEEETENEA